MEGKILADTYEINERLNAGGAGIVYKATHIRLQTDVVVKKLRDDVVDKVKIRQEADILKKLKSSYLPRVYDFIEAEDGIYTVMDYIKGENLEDAVKHHGKYSQKEVKKWAEQLGEALSYLHSQRPPIIHSDIKPANIMLTPNGDICLIDFNIALAMGSTKPAAVGISAGYSPPEQYRDPAVYERCTMNYSDIPNESMIIKRKKDDKTELLTEDKTELLDTSKTEMLNSGTELLAEVACTVSDTDRNTTKSTALEKKKNRTTEYLTYIGKGIDTRSDIYSLGCTLYYLLTGTNPSGFGIQTSIGKTNTNLSEGMVLLVDRMMELAPEKRYQNGKEFLKAVRGIYKLDRRYRKAKIRQILLQLAGITSMTAGVVALMMGAKVTVQERNQQYHDYLENAEAYKQEYAYELARNSITDAQTLYPERIHAYREEICLLYQSGDYEGCYSRGKEMLEAPAFLIITEEDRCLYTDICCVVANACYELKKYDMAENLLADIIEEGTECSVYYRDYSIVLAKNGKLERAQEALETAINLGLEEDSIYLAKGEILQVGNQLDEAIESLKRAIALTEDKQLEKRAVLLSVEIYRKKGNTSLEDEIALLENYKDVFDIGSNMVLVEYLADAYIRAAQIDLQNETDYYNNALELFRIIAEQGHLTYQIQENMAILHENLGQFDEAKEMLLSMTENYAERYEPYKRLAYLEADRQQQKKNLERDYNEMKNYSEMAFSLYDEKKQDMEMEMLRVMLQELENGGWFLN